MSTRSAIVCPGQGSQRVGMLEVPSADDSLTRLIDAAEALSDLPLREIATAGPAERLSDTRAAQPLLYLADWAWGRALIESGLTPSLLAGHSLGELAALALADVYSVEAGLELVVERSELMADCAESTPGGMTAVLGLEGQAVADAVGAIPGVWVANDNAPGQVVVSGTAEGLEAAAEALTEAGARRLIPLAVAGPFHSPLMEPAADAFADLLRLTAFADASVPVLSNATPTPERSGAALKERLMMQMTSPVRWTETMRAIAAPGPATVVEAGPGTVLKGLARRVERLTALAVEEDGLQTICEEV